MQMYMNYGIILVMVLTLLGLLLLCGGRGRVAPVAGRWALPVGAMTVLCGFVPFLNSLGDGLLWWKKGITPPPTTAVINLADKVMLIGTLVFGGLGGLFLVALGLRFVRGDGRRSGAFQLWAITPSVWLWMRLARYEISYASAVDIGQSFYDFLLLVVLLLFLFSFARYIVGIGEDRPRFLLFLSLGSALTSLSGALVRFVSYLMKTNTTVYIAGQLAGIADVAVGLLALLFAAAQIFGKTAALPKEEPAPSVSETADDHPMPPIPAADPLSAAAEENMMSAVDELIETPASEEELTADQILRDMHKG